MSNEESKRALSVRDTQSAESALKPIKKVNEFLADALDGFEKSDLLKPSKRRRPGQS